MNTDTVLFDLDGTLLDTAPDLAFALNQVLIEQQREPLPFEKIRPWVSHGGKTMIRKSFNLIEPETDIDFIHKRFLAIYSSHIADNSDFFPNMEIVLDNLESKGLKWGIVTNKPAWLTEPLLQKLNLIDRSACYVSGDTLPQNKPHPAPLLHACKLLDTTPESCIYVGDAKRDIEAGQRAGMQTLIAAYGYLGNDDEPTLWGADGILQKPMDLLAWV
ncbi:phosphoglycolate phosphatase [Candidatus Halobeggiatoa sp. HSG11]|nr:phosphoglycolate phosphatase [Candidatus Halobeggiatoa sp. HSG11]